ncbi:MAG: thiamine phosphate synthase [Xanthomonadales bacterium]|nr:thiamine phosphate synthase [Xanthomonadales bacterium]MBK7144312.1 thiamine phosphate synthase [Xanthomonadales bacterium]MCC6560788.1 thiamine phosphate synthase [Xanthomonadales bacterium]
MHGVYLLTRAGGDSAALCAGVAAALRGGVRIVQYRDKSGDRGLRREQAEALRALTRAHNALLIINDDVALAAAVDADGVHLGEHDGDLAAARTALGADAIIGASCYNDLARAEAAARAGADYLAFGAFFASTTKPGARRADPALLGAAAKLLLPRVAIGGIDAHNARPLIAAGADAVAVLGAIWEADDREGAARELIQLFSTRSAHEP